MLPFASRNRAKPPCPSGFTVIELLVVIAIVAVLAAILFPVFAQAKSAAKKTTALRNHQQMGTALLIYTGDYDDHLPNRWPLWPGYGDTLLEALARNEGRVLSREYVQERVWNHDESFSNTIAGRILQLRQKVDDGHAVRLIQTVYGQEYVLRA